MGFFFSRTARHSSPIIGSGANRLNKRRPYVMMAEGVIVCGRCCYIPATDVQRNAIAASSNTHAADVCCLSNSTTSTKRPFARARPVCAPSLYILGRFPKTPCWRRTALKVQPVVRLPCPNKGPSMKRTTRNEKDDLIIITTTTTNVTYDS